MIHDYSTGNEPAPDEQTWTTEQLREDFEVLGFRAPYVLVRSRSDGERGLLEFRHSPRLYWGWVPEGAPRGDHPA